MSLRSMFLYGASCLIIMLFAHEGLCAETGQVPATPDMPPELNECLARGNNAAAQKDFELAIKEFSSCAEKFPKAAPAHFFLGMAYFMKKDMEKAIASLKTAVKLAPNNLDAPAMLGRIYSLDKEKLGVARELLERVVEAAPYRHSVRFDLARVYAQQGNMLKAAKEFGIIFSGEPEFALYHTAYAELLIAAGEKKEARDHLLRAQALAPNAEAPKKLLKTLDDAPDKPKTP